jgi:UDP-N-acetyl-D-glucosamine dehydrogenase
MNVRLGTVLEASELESMSALAYDFAERAKTRTLTVGILGLGYVGLPLAQALIAEGFKVQGFDVNPARVKILTEGRSPFRHISDERVKATMDTGRFEGISDFNRLDEPDAILICVPTPLNRYKEPDLSYVRLSSEAIARRLRRGQLVVLESTTWPGTCDEVMIPILEEGSGLKAGVDFAVAYSPEREDPGNAHFETSTIPKIVGANSHEEQAMAVAVYEAFVPAVVPVENLRTAEAVKVTENIFRWINIGMVNELKVIFGRMGIDVWDVINGAATKPFGFMPFYPGPGVGGHCIPIDPYYLSWKAKEFGVAARFIELAGEVNDYMPRYVVERLAEGMNDRLRKPLAGSRILVVGLAYKANIDDARESPAIPVIELLRKRSADVHYYDSGIAKVVDLHDHPSVEGMQSIVWNAETLRTFDAAIITTAHKEIDYELLCQCVPLVVDTRNATHDLAEHADKIIKA